MDLVAVILECVSQRRQAVSIAPETKCHEGNQNNGNSVSMKTRNWEKLSGVSSHHQDDRGE